MTRLDKEIAEMQRDIDLAKKTQLTRNVLAAEHLQDVLDGPGQVATPLDPLVDRHCVLLDGSCHCKEPYIDCKYIQNHSPAYTGHLPPSRA